MRNKPTETDTVRGQLDTVLKSSLNRNQDTLQERVFKGKVVSKDTVSNYLNSPFSVAWSFSEGQKGSVVFTLMPFIQGRELAYGEAYDITLYSIDGTNWYFNPQGTIIGKVTGNPIRNVALRLEGET